MDNINQNNKLYQDSSPSPVEAPSRLTFNTNKEFCQKVFKNNDYENRVCHISATKKNDSEMHDYVFFICKTYECNAQVKFLAGEGMDKNEVYKSFSDFGFENITLCSIRKPKPEHLVAFPNSDLLECFRRDLFKLIPGRKGEIPYATKSL